MILYVDTNNVHKNTITIHLNIDILFNDNLDYKELHI